MIVNLNNSLNATFIEKGPWPNWVGPVIFAAILGILIALPLVYVHIWRQAKIWRAEKKIRKVKCR